MLCLGLWWGCCEQSFLWVSATTTGKVNSKPVERSYFLYRGGGKQTKFSFHYTFTVDTKTYEGWTDSATAPSEVVTVYYDKRNPSRNRVDEPQPATGWKLAGMGFACVFFGVLGYYRKRNLGLHTNNSGGSAN